MKKRKGRPGLDDLTYGVRDPGCWQWEISESFQAKESLVVSFQVSCPLIVDRFY